MGFTKKVIPYLFVAIGAISCAEGRFVNDYALVDSSRKKTFARRDLIFVSDPTIVRNSFNPASDYINNRYLHLNENGIAIVGYTIIDIVDWEKRTLASIIDTLPAKISKIYSYTTRVKIKVGNDSFCPGYVQAWGVEGDGIMKIRFLYNDDPNSAPWDTFSAEMRLKWENDSTLRLIDFKGASIRRGYNPKAPDIIPPGTLFYALKGEIPEMPYQKFGFYQRAQKRKLKKQKTQE